jgi:hypothetical protein
MELQPIGGQGLRCSLAWLIDDDGRCWGLEFLDSRPREKAKTLTLFLYATDSGPGTKRFKALKADMNGFYELRPTDQITYFCFRDRDTYVITNGCWKTTDTVAQIHKTRAQQLRDRYRRQH